MDPSCHSGILNRTVVIITVKSQRFHLRQRCFLNDVFYIFLKFFVINMRFLIPLRFIRNDKDGGYGCGRRGGGAAPSPTSPSNRRCHSERSEESLDCPDNQDYTIPP